MSEPVSKQDVANMWEFLLTFATNREDNFEFWYELLKTNYLSVFYSDECMSIGLPVAQSVTFAVCPNELQVKIIKLLPTWDTHKYLSRTIWSEINAPIMLGYCTHACKMPLSYSKDITDCINLYKSVFLKKPVAGIEDRMRVHWQNWLRSISRVFFIPSKPVGEELKTHVELCELVVGVFQFFVVDLHAVMDEPQWVSLQILLVDVVAELLSTNDCTQVQTVAEVMSEPLLDVMFISFIGSVYTTEEMWDYLRGKISGLLGWKSVVLQWQAKVLVLTDLVVSNLFSSGGTVPANRKSIRRDTTFAQNIGERAVSSKDPRISSLEWNPVTLRAMWFQVLSVLGSPVKITNGELFQMSLGCISMMIEMLIQAELDFSTSEQPPPFDVFEVFCPMLVEATSVDSKRGRGAIVAHTLLCEMFLQMRDRSFDPGLLSHFYRTLVSGLNGGFSAISWAVIRNCRAIFWLNIPGAEVLMPHLLDQCENTFGTKALKNPPPEKVQTRYLSLLAAMICHFQHFQEVAPADVEQFDRVVNAFVTVSEFAKVAVPKSLCACINGLACCAFQEVLGRGRSEVISMCLNAILAHVTHENAEVCSVALQALGSLSHIGSEIRAIDSSLLDLMVTGLCQSGQSMLVATRPALCTNILFTILEILLAGDAHSARVAQSVFTLCESAINFQRTGATAGTAPKRGSHAGKSKATGASEPKEKEEKKGKLGLLRKKEKPGVTTEPEKEQEVSSDVQDVQNAGETVAEMLLAHMDNFPAPAGPEICECREYDGKKHQGDDDMNPNTIFWIFGDSALLSLRQVDPSTGGPIVRVTLRNMTGRFVWDTQLMYEPLKESLVLGVEIEPDALTKPDPSFEGEAAYKAACGINTEKEAREAGVLPTPDIEHQRDGLFETLSYLQEEHPVIVPSENVHFTSPFTPTNLPEEELSHYETSLELQEEDERNQPDLGERSCFRVTAKPVANTGSTFHLARMFFAQMGFTAEGMLSMLCLVENSDKFRRTLSTKEKKIVDFVVFLTYVLFATEELDKRMTREHVKVGCLRVAKGRDTQKEMLHLDERSVGFRDAVDAMAWSVDLETHLGFGGQLPKRGSAPYWATPSCELVFHDTTRMPT
jgi:hypothetical protein